MMGKERGREGMTEETGREGTTEETGREGTTEGEGREGTTEREGREGTMKGEGEGGNEARELKGRKKLPGTIKMVDNFQHHKHNYIQRLRDLLQVLTYSKTRSFGWFS